MANLYSYWNANLNYKKRFYDQLHIFIGSILEIYIYFILGERKNIYLNANVIQKFFFDEHIEHIGSVITKESDFYSIWEIFQ